MDVILRKRASYMYVTKILTNRKYATKDHFLVHKRKPQLVVGFVKNLIFITVLGLVFNGSTL